MWKGSKDEEHGIIPGMLRSLYFFPKIIENIETHKKRHCQNYNYDHLDWYLFHILKIKNVQITAPNLWCSPNQNSPVAPHCTLSKIYLLTWCSRLFTIWPQIPCETYFPLLLLIHSIIQPIISRIWPGLSYFAFDLTI